MRAGAVNVWYSKRADEEVTSFSDVIWNNKIANWAEDFHFNFQEAYPFQYMWKSGAFFPLVRLWSNLNSQGHSKNWENGALIYLFICSCKTSIKIMYRYHWGICSMPLYFLLSFLYYMYLPMIFRLLWRGICFNRWTAESPRYYIGKRKIVCEAF